MKILVADDDGTSRLITEMSLRKLGHDCLSAVDGSEAWDTFQSLSPDVVLSDWMMPGLNGLQLCRNIRASTGGAYSYFIMVTSRDARNDIFEGMSAGADDYLIKPLDLDDLRARLIAAERVTSLHRQLAEQRTELEGLNHELGTIARRDPLTGLGNRLALQEDLDLLEARATRYGHSYCVALVDVDHFKSYNDTYGHQGGDHVLQAVAAQIKAIAREGDALYRYGGDEFLCVFPEQSASSGTVAAERMRLSLERLAIPHTGNSLDILTCSVGVACLDRRTKSVSDVIKEADEALYAAKQLGRNRVEHVSPLLDQSSVDADRRGQCPRPSST
jgi:two-component system chemotaxis response regulator CheY